MRTALKPYSEYRDSGVDWLARVPKHWAIVRLKRLAEINPTLRPESVTRAEQAVFLPMKSVGIQGQINCADRRPATDVRTGFTTFERGDVLVAKITPCFENGKGAALNDLPELIGFGSTEFHVLRPRAEIEARWLYYWTRARPFRDAGTNSMIGAAGQQRVPSRFVADCPVPAPPPEEQWWIADFLDAYTAQVHRLIAAKRRTIAALIERKRSIITNRLYTIGDAGSPPTPSNPDWPFRAIKRIANVSFSSVDKHIYEHERQVRVCNYVDVYKNDRVGLVTPFREGSVTEAEYGNYALKAGDVIVTKDSEDWKDICVPCLVTDDIPDTVCGYHLAILRPNTEQISGEYLYFALPAAPTTWQFHKAATGITRYGIGKNEIGVAVIPLPPRTEQDEICHALARELESVDAAKDKVSREIDLILEYRDSLIASVVTGQLDVREAAVRIVEGDELADDTAIEEEDMEDALDAVD
jgi:type I restriction enzyme S subunit